MIIFGITGQTGAGKTTLLQAVQQLGGVTIDCDALYWKLLQEHPDLQEKIHNAFPNVVQTKGKIDRKLLGAEVFSSPQKLLQLNAITHPIILNKTDELLEKYRIMGHTIVAIDAIALIESGLQKKCNVTIAVVANESIRISRIMKRDNISEYYGKKRISAQKNEQFYKENSDIYIENSFSTHEEFLAYALQILKKQLHST